MTAFTILGILAYWYLMARIGFDLGYAARDCLENFIGGEVFVGWIAFEVVRPA